MFASPEMTNPVGKSKICAKNAVKETALSRIALSIFAVSSPVFLILGLNKVKIIQRAVSRSQNLRLCQELLSVIICIQFSLPAAISIFEPVSKLPAS